jgi:nuclear transcription factor Y, alpha
MRDLDFSLNFNFSRHNSNGWQNFAFDDNSQEISLPKHHSINNQSLLHFQNLLAEPPRPPASIYNCIESDQEEQGDIREVEYVQTEGEAKHVNSKQYFRMMKRRIKKVITEYHQKDEAHQDPAEEPKGRPKYLHESRHQHAVRRVRGKDGKFLASKQPVI